MSAPTERDRYGYLVDSLVGQSRAKAEHELYSLLVRVLTSALPQELVTQAYAEAAARGRREDA